MGEFLRGLLFYNKANRTVEDETSPDFINRLCVRPYSHSRPLFGEDQKYEAN